MTRARPAVLAVVAMLLVAACTGPTDGQDEPVGPPDVETDPTVGEGEPASDEADGDEAPDDAGPPAEGEDGHDEVGPPDAEVALHGTWVHLFDDTLKDRDGIRALVDELADADATAIFAQVARRHDAYYRSEVLPRTPDPALADDLDVLDELLTAAHARGLEVHAWLSIAPTWHEVYAELDPPDGWLAVEHGHLADEDDRWVTRSVDGTWSQYLDPALPAVRAHVVAVVAELVDRYPVDGIHLDYVRYESERHGYHPTVLARYRAETGATGTPAPTDEQWSSWRRDQTRRMVVEVADTLAATAPDVTLSAAVISWGARPGGRGPPPS